METELATANKLCPPSHTLAPILRDYTPRQIIDAIFLWDELCESLAFIAEADDEGVATNLWALRKLDPNQDVRAQLEKLVKTYAATGVRP